MKREVFFWLGLEKGLGKVEGGINKVVGGKRSFAPTLHSCSYNTVF